MRKLTALLLLLLSHTIFAQEALSEYNNYEDMRGPFDGILTLIYISGILLVIGAFLYVIGSVIEFFNPNQKKNKI